MSLADVTITREPLVLSSQTDVTYAETQLGAVFPPGYRDYVTTLGELEQWRTRIGEFWFWGVEFDVLPKGTALKCIVIELSFAFVSRAHTQGVPM